MEFVFLLAMALFAAYGVFSMIYDIQRIVHRFINKEEE